MTKPEEKRCWICRSTRLLYLHCKIKCRDCGFTRDCSDP